MNLETDYRPLDDGIGRAFEAAKTDTLVEARGVAAKRSRTGRFAGSLEVTATESTSEGLEARLGSPLVSARAKEKGAFISAKRGPYLVFRTSDGWRKVKSVRLAPQPVVTPAGRLFPTFMDNRLREELG